MGEFEGMLELFGCQCCRGVEICCPAPCCRQSLSIEWGEKCGSIEWTGEGRPPRVDIYLATYEGKPMLRIVKSPDQASSQEPTSDEPAA